MSKRIVFMGAGAVGGYVGGHIARTGEDVTLIDPWPEHIEYIKHNGSHLSGTQGEHTVRLKALHLHEVQSLFKEPVDIAFICTKSYDTEWATMMIKQYLAQTASSYLSRTVSMKSALPISWAGARWSAALPVRSVSMPTRRGMSCARGKRAVQPIQSSASVRCMGALPRASRTSCVC